MPSWIPAPDRERHQRLGDHPEYPERHSEGERAELLLPDPDEQRSRRARVGRARLGDGERGCIRACAEINQRSFAVVVPEPHQPSWVPQPGRTSGLYLMRCGSSASGPRVSATQSAYSGYVPSNQVVWESPSNARMWVAIRSRNHRSCEITTAQPGKSISASSSAPSVSTSRSLVGSSRSRTFPPERSSFARWTRFRSPPRDPDQLLLVAAPEVEPRDVLPRVHLPLAERRSRPGGRRSPSRPF